MTKGQVIVSLICFQLFFLFIQFTQGIDESDKIINLMVGVIILLQMKD